VRPRALSAMYMLGLGSGSEGPFMANGREETDEVEGSEGGDGLDSGVE
jgi:hypothetical protein